MAISRTAKPLPKCWTDAELESDAAVAKGAFRNERLLEPLDLYNRCFATFADIFRKLIEKLPDITAEPVDAEIIAELIDGRDAQKAFRYLTGGKAAHWYRELGRAQVIPSAVLSGVYSTANLADVQESKGVCLFWQHRLADLAAFVKKVK